jgi:hypothetical protein
VRKLSLAVRERRSPEGQGTREHDSWHKWGRWQRLRFKLFERGQQREFVFEHTPPS